MKWPWSKQDGKADSAAKAEYDEVRQQRPVVKKKARELAELPPEEWAARVARALRHRPT